MTILYWWIGIIAATVGLATACHFSKSANGMLPGCLRWEDSYYGRHAVTQPRLTPPRLTWRQRAARRLRCAALDAWDFIRIRELRARALRTARPDSAGTAPCSPRSGGGAAGHQGHVERRVPGHRVQG